ncbi:unnamed protein product [Toxocara canis]|uniref:Quaking_NLS domain-containing protein n=1 Tax=Toxocara canis TaxID=6265 RepID=A0A183VF25_TOXCA|nr:unnamed protein product [Toxocara canis]
MIRNKPCSRHTTRWERKALLHLPYRRPTYNRTCVACR